MRNEPETRTIPGDPRPPAALGAPETASPSSSDNPEEIRVEIIQTRAEMSATLDAIQQRLDPDRLKAQARDEVEQLKKRVKDDVHNEVEHLKVELHDATIGKAEHFMREVDYQAREAGYSLLDRVRANPIPAALAGFGLAWLFMSGRSGSHASSHHRYFRDGGYGRGYPENYGSGRDARDYRSGRDVAGAGDRAPYSYERGPYGYGQDRTEAGYANRGFERSGGRGVTDQVADAASNAANQARSQIDQVTDQVQDRVQHVGDQVQDQVQQVGQQVQQFGNQMQDQISNVGDQVQDRFQGFSGDVVDEFTRARWMAERAMRENPLAVGVVAMAVGAAVGMMVPETPQEEHLLGGAREQFVQRAGAVAQDALENVQGKVQQAAHQADQTVNAMASNAATPGGQKSGASSTGQSASAPGQSGSNVTTQNSPGGQSRVA